MSDRSTTWVRAVGALLLGLLLTVSASPLAVAQDDATPVPPELLKLQDRIELTDEQKEQVRPVFEEQAKRRRELMAKHGAGPDSPTPMTKGQRSSLGRAMREVRNETDKKLAKILTAEQLQEYRKMQEEARERRREQFRRGGR